MKWKEDKLSSRRAYNEKTNTFSIPIVNGIKKLLSYDKMKKNEPIQSAKLAVSPGPFSTGVKANVEMTITAAINN